jgi:hypothetical protein
VQSLELPSFKVAPTSKIVQSLKAPSLEMLSLKESELHEMDLDTMNSSALIRDETDCNYLYSPSELEQETIFHERFESLKDAERALEHAVHLNQQVQRTQIAAGADKSIGGKLFLLQQQQQMKI